ncbi:MAG: hypothetical protein O3C43_16070 [Verrucomicrobia bacterium]|nr:hypothetical protein [Verrucomicrobiota bacterium]
MKDPATRNKILFYLIGSSDYMCQSAKIGDEDFAIITRDLLTGVGFDKKEIWESFGRFAQQNFNQVEFDYLMMGADHYKKWVVEENKFAPMLLAMDLIAEE